MSIRQFYKLFSINIIHLSTYAMICFSLSTLLVQDLEAQIFVPSETVQLAESSILSLKEHSLVVRLHTNQNSLDKLKALSDKNTKPTDAYAKKASLIKEERDWENLNMIQSMKKYYTFSNILFIPEDKYEDFLAGSTEKICMNEKLELIDLENKPNSFIVLSRVIGHHYDWQSLTHDGEILNDPFPSYFKINSSWDSFIKGMFKPNANIPVEKYEALAKKISNKMEKYYTNVTY